MNSVHVQRFVDDKHLFAFRSLFVVRDPVSSSLGVDTAPSSLFSATKTASPKMSRTNCFCET